MNSELSNLICQYKYEIKVPNFDPRLQRRYQTLVRQHLSLSQSAATGLRVLPETKDSFAATQAAWHFFANDVRRVEFEGESLLLKEVEEHLRKKLKYVREVKYLGRKAFQYVAETEVVLSRMGRTKRPTKEQPNKRKYYKGKPIRLRYIFSEVRDKKGKVLASWRLWTNVENEVKGEEIALWYYWRWRIESFFKLLKRGGQHLEQWQQESVEAIAKRLLIVSQVCVIVWSLAASKDEKAGEIREFLVRLSGRLMKRGVEYTIPALLSGMWQFLTLIDVLEKYTTAELKEVAQEFLQILGSKTEFKDV